MRSAGRTPGSVASDQSLTVPGRFEDAAPSPPPTPHPKGGVTATPCTKCNSGVFLPFLRRRGRWLVYGLATILLGVWACGAMGVWDNGVQGMGRRLMSSASCDSLVPKIGE